MRLGRRAVGDLRRQAVDLDVGGGVPFVAKDGLVWGASPTEVWAVDSAWITDSGSSNVYRIGPVSLSS